MVKPLPEPPEEGLKKPRLQFSLAALLLTVAALAVVLALMLHAPIRPANIALLFAVLALSALAFTGLAYGRSSFRAFCIGALVPLVPMVIFIAMNSGGITSPFVLSGTELIDPDGVDEIWIPGSPRFFGAGILASIGLGYLCVAFRWFLLRRY